MTIYNFLNLKESSFVMIAGDDRLDFLQGIITNDIRKCGENSPIYSCMLSPQGKFLCDFFIIKLKDSYLLEINSAFLKDFLQKLKIYKLRSKVEIIQNTNYLSIVLMNYPEKFEHFDSISFIDPRNKILGSKIYIHQKYENEFKNLKNFKEIEFKTYRKLMMQNLIPFSTEDLIINKSLLLENNFENLNAIDWDKGCYVGKEITARMKYRALLKKNIRYAELISGKIQKGEIIFDKKSKVGEIISRCESMVMIMVKLEIEKNSILNTENAEIKIKN